jgi:hypothetical protein
MRNFLLLGPLVVVAFSAAAQEDSGGRAIALSRHLATQQAFSEAAVCHNGSVLIGKVAAARVRGDSRAEVYASLPPNLPPVVAELVDVAFSYPSPGAQNAEDFYRSCTATAINRMNAAIEGTLKADSQR